MDCSRDLVYLHSFGRPNSGRPSEFLHKSQSQHAYHIPPFYSLLELGQNELQGGSGERKGSSFIKIPLGFLAGVAFFAAAIVRED
mgnify:CR=1 FL=1